MKSLYLFTLSTVTLAASFFTQAENVQSQQHGERYTFFLNENGSRQLQKMNSQMADLLDTMSYSDSRDLMKANNLQNESYRLTGISPSFPRERGLSRVRDDGKPVKVLTCAMMTLKINQMQSSKVQCKDEVGAEYIGFQGWPSRNIIAKTCQVGEPRCPVYLSRQGDSPMQRDDSVTFKATRKAAQKTYQYDDIQSQGCHWVNESLRLGTGNNQQCQSIHNVDVGHNKVTATYTTQSGQAGTLVVTFEGVDSIRNNLRYVTARPDGKELFQIYKEGQWICNSAGGICR